MGHICATFFKFLSYNRTDFPQNYPPIFLFNGPVWINHWKAKFMSAGNLILG